MNIKKYIIFGLLFIFAVALYVWNLELDDYTFNIFSYSWTYSIFIWFLAPLVALFIFSLLHIIFYSLVNFLNKKTIERDIDRLQTVISQKMLNNKIELSGFKTEQLKKLANFVEHLNIEVGESDYDFDGNTNANIKYLKKIKNGEYVSSRKLSLDKDSPYYNQNILNKIKTNDDYAKKVFNQFDDDDFSDEHRAYAFDKLINSNNMDEMKQIIADNTLDKSSFLKLINKDSKNSDNKPSNSSKNDKKQQQALSNVEILDYAKDIKLSKDEFLNIAKAYLKTSDPEKLISLFDDLKSKDENATNAYLYILAEYEMLDKLRDIIDFLKPQDAKVYRALLDLKDASKQYKISDFVI
jgi:hypothetical protein